MCRLAIEPLRLPPSVLSESGIQGWAGCPLSTSRTPGVGFGETDLTILQLPPSVKSAIASDSVF